MKAILEKYKTKLALVQKCLSEMAIAEYPSSPIRLSERESCYREFIYEIEIALEKENNAKLIQ
jgi:hypothetical protein